MHIQFHKYHGTGNDFILVDGRESPALLSTLTIEVVKKLCDRHFGIGADGLIVLNNHDDLDFEMVYYNADGRQSSMCGNGGRCIARFAYNLGLIATDCQFLAVDGPHEAKVDPSTDLVSLKMKNVTSFKQLDEDTVLDTGSPHYVRFVGDIMAPGFVEMARGIRNRDAFARKGINVNFAERQDGKLTLRTYERGVEDETLSCGTGVVATAIAAHIKGLLSEPRAMLHARGGTLEVTFDPDKEHYRNVWLKGEAKHVYEGKISVPL